MDQLPAEEQDASREGGRERQITPFHLRLREALGTESQREFGARAGIKQNTLSRILNGGIPDMDQLIGISRASGRSLEWLVLGGSEPKPFPAIADSEAFSLVPRLDVRASAGSGALATVEEPVGLVAFRTEWLRRIGVNPRTAEILEAGGDSMYPTISPGDLLLVDRSIDRVINDGIYVVIHAGMVLLKRVQLLRDGSVLLKSDNPNYSDETVPAAEVPDLQVAARVCWHGKSV